MPEHRLTFLADAPDFAGAQFPDGAPEDISVEDHTPPSSWIQVAKLGSFRHPRYGKFEITPATFESFIRNFDAVSGGEVPLDFDHEPDLGGSTRACGWIKALRREGAKLMARVEWTWQGAFAIREREYRYISPTWQMDYVSDDGSKRGPTLLAAALTNRPFFERMAVVGLSRTFSRESLEFAEELTARQQGEPCDCTDPDCEQCREYGCKRPHLNSRPSDSRAAMDKIAKLFSLSTDADEDAIVAAASPVVETFGQVAEALGLEADASPEDVLTAAKDAAEAAEKAPEEGQVVLTASQVKDLQEKAENASAELAEMRFDKAFTKAVDEGRAVPAQREGLLKTFKLNEDLALETIEGFQKVVNTNPAGKTGDAADAPEGVDPDRFMLDRKVKAFMAEHDEENYSVALEKVQAAEEVPA